MLRLAVALVCLASTSYADDRITPRKFSGSPLADSTLPAGTLSVRLVYDDVRDPKPPAGVAITLVGYKTDDRVTVVARPSDATGRATFTGLDHSGAIAYYALVAIPRGKVIDRMVSMPIVLSPAAGVRVTLSAETRDSTAAPLDYTPTAVPANQLRVTLEGVDAPNTTVTLTDATTGKVVASGATSGKTVDLAVPRGTVFYATSTSSRGTFRSQPFQPIAGRGTGLVIVAWPRTLVRLTALASFDEKALGVAMRMRIENNSWSPHALADEMPLPRGFAKAELHDEDRDLVTLTTAGFKLRRPLPPQGLDVRIWFELPIANGKARWDLDLPFGLVESTVSIVRDPGVTVELTAGTKSETTDRNGKPAIVVSGISITPNKSMVMTVTAPKFSAAEVALRKACKEMQPERVHTLLGKPAPKTTLALLDGSKLDLARLRGKHVLVNFSATFNPYARSEPPTLAKLATAIRGLEIVSILADRDRKDVENLVGAKPPYRVALDPVDAGGPSVLGPIASAWSVPKIPETFLVDKQGIVRMYFINVRDWGSADAIACLSAAMRP